MKTIKILLLISIIAVTAFKANAQGKFSENTPEELADKQTKWMKTQLVLDETVAQQAYVINLKYAEQIISLRESNKRRISKLRELKSITKNKDGELKKIFTPNQYEEYLAKKEEMKEAIKEKRKTKNGSNNDSSVILNKLEYDGLERSYYIYLPKSYNSLSELPVVLVLHGGGKADGKETSQRLGYNKIAEREDFIAVYPNGINAQWNDGRGVNYFVDDNTNIDDVGFISALIDKLIEDYKGNPSRIYITGLSNGGMMTLRLGCELGNKLTAIAPVIANIPKNIYSDCKPVSSLPILLMNGTKDPLVPWDGGFVKAFNKEMGEVVSTEKTVQFWVQNNNCNTTPTVAVVPDTDSTDNSTVIVNTYENKGSGADVVLYTIEGGGHTLPGSNIPNVPSILGEKNNDIDGAEIIWGFFKKTRNKHLINNKIE